MKEKFKNALKRSLNKANKDQKHGLASLLDNLNAAALIGLTVSISTGAITVTQALLLALLSVILIINAFVLRS